MLAVPSQIFWSFFSLLAGRPRLRRRLNSFLLQAQARLGVGSGGHVAVSGEAVLFRVLDEFTERQQKDVCIFDVGANQGQYLDSIFRGLPGRRFSVHSFEPSAGTFKILNEKFGHVPNVHLNSFGLGRERGEFDFFSDAEGSGLGSLTHRQLEHLGIHHDRSERVIIETLDRYCADHGIQTIDLLKIDVEGHELDVLQGGVALFSRRGVRLLTFEFGGCNIDTRTYVRDFWDFFMRQGMLSFHRIMPCGRLFRIESYTESLEMFRTTNFVVTFDNGINTATLEYGRRRLPVS